MLAALIAGAVILMISAGNDKLVAKGKLIITGAVIGGVIVFFSFLIVNFVVKAVGGKFINEGKVQINPQGRLETPVQQSEFKDKTT
jgi:flagellar biosynthesis component FlhA